MSDWETISRELLAYGNDTLTYEIGKDSKPAQYRLQRLYPPEEAGVTRPIELLRKFLPGRKMRSSADLIKEAERA